MTQAPTPLDMLALAVRIESAERQAAQSSGQSDVLYDARCQAAYASILAAAPTAHRADTEAALLTRGFEPNFVPYEAGPGECGLTGIEIDHCPCGQHP